MKINIIAIGKLKQNLIQAFNSYVQKINFYAKVHLIELRECNDNNLDVKRQKETTAILEKIPKDSLVLLCAINGRAYDSISFSHFFEHQNLTFIIGGSHGVIESKFKHQISFSKLTMPHQLFRIILIEQIYRGIAIKNNLKYHK